ncbi:MAG TPA: acetyl-CoA carboxylase biotin carboxyl carrier protein subunit [Sneathiellales bacterium]|nr:acetyl-CoA carboxylase biotin carboxyl carrier protein subunit [Sneathiellales bacterium]
MALNEIYSEIAGTIWKIKAKVGDQVKADDAIMIIECMKMEIPVEAPVAGTVKEMLVEEEQSVDEGQPLAIIET